MPFLPPNQQCQSTEGKDVTTNLLYTHKVPVAFNHFYTGSFVCLMYVCQGVLEVVNGRIVEDACRPVITSFRDVTRCASLDAAAHTAGLYGTVDNASLLTNAKVRLYNCDSAYDVFSIGVTINIVIRVISPSALRGDVMFCCCFNKYFSDLCRTSYLNI